jgi:hypothetical protein
MKTLALHAVLAAIALAPMTAAAEPTHYVVFGFDAAGRAEPRFHAIVERAADGGSAVAPTALPGGAIGWRVVKDGQRGERRHVEVARVLRAEFAHDVVRGEGEIDAHATSDPDPSFVLRIPLREADAIELDTALGVQHVDLHALAAAADRLPLAAFEPARVDVQRAPTGGASGNRVDILVLGDGYTSAQQALFATHVASLKTAMFAVTPYKEYENFVNWQSGFIASAQSGADHPAYQAGCTAITCCADTAAQGDAAAGTFVNTALDGRYCTNQIHRLLTVSGAKVFAAAAAYPDWDKILVTVNDPLYGGAGGTYAVTSANAQAALIVIHEYGHSFHQLADEYTTPYPGFPACSDLGATLTCEANVTNQTNPLLVKWRSWFTPAIAIPTPAGTPGTGLFEGARYLTSGMYRPTGNSCLMRALGTSFCSVCRQEYVKKLYRGGFGAPVAGIDLIEPGSESPSPATTVQVGTGTTRVFSTSILRPTIGSVALQWFLDGTPMPAANGDSLAFTPTSATPSMRTLELRATDTTAFVDATMADGLTTHTRSWTIQVVDDLLFRNGFD